MQGLEPADDAGFYFSLPRLIAKLRGRNAARSERNRIEAKIAGAAMHGIVYLYGAQWLLAGRPIWQQVLLLFPLAALLLVWWMIFFAVTAPLLRLLQMRGLLRNLPIVRVQSVIAGTIVTAVAWQLVLASSWVRFVGWIWIAAVSLNLVAALLLVFSHADAAEAK
jgi:hypothetical protein